jgi:uncharacterized membrane protein YhaH (DUF805 family)
MFGSVLGGIRRGALSGVSFLVALLLLDAVVVLVLRTRETIGWIGGQPVPADLANNAHVRAISEFLQTVPETLGMATAVIALLLAAFAHLNLLAQRFRDMGLPGWRWGISLGAAVSLTCVVLPFHQQLALLVPVLVALVLIPSGAFQRWRRWFGVPGNEIALADKQSAR